MDNSNDLHEVFHAVARSSFLHDLLERSFLEAAVFSLDGKGKGIMGYMIMRLVYWRCLEIS